MNNTEVERLNRLSNQLEAIYRPLNPIPFTSPVNRREEERHLQTAIEKGQTYNPQFLYADPPPGWTRDLEAFLGSFAPENQWERYLYEDAEFNLATSRTVESRDPVQVSVVSTKTYGVVTDDLLRSAYELLNSAAATQSAVGTISADEAAAFLAAALKRVGLTDWEVLVERRMTARMSVRSVEKRVNVQADAMFDQRQLDRLLVHEIGTHVFRYVNGAMNGLRMLRMGLSDYMMTEEGLATYHEQRYELSDPATLRRYALRVVAAYLSRNHSFYEVFIHLLQYTDAKTAYPIVTRAKRGLEDTSQPGVHVKDKVYFEGLQEITAHLNTNPNDYSLLMSGKVALHMLPALKDLKSAGFVSEPQYLPEQLIT